jgi:hypothetical protein
LAYFSVAQASTFLLWKRDGFTQPLHQLAASDHPGSPLFSERVKQFVILEKQLHVRKRNTYAPISASPLADLWAEVHNLR